MEVKSQLQGLATSSLEKKSPLPGYPLDRLAGHLNQFGHWEEEKNSSLEGN
jgi:hypothetical protein